MESNGRSLQYTDPRSDHKGAELEGDGTPRSENGKISAYSLITRVNETKTTEHTDTLGHSENLHKSCVDEFHQATDTVITEKFSQQNNNVIEMDSVEQTHVDTRCKETSLHSSQDKLYAVNCKDDVNDNSESTNNIDDAVEGEVFVQKPDFGNEECAGHCSRHPDSGPATVGDVSDRPQSVLWPESPGGQQGPAVDHTPLRSDVIPDLSQTADPAVSVSCPQREKGLPPAEHASCAEPRLSSPPLSSPPLSSLPLSSPPLSSLPLSSLTLSSPPLSSPPLSSPPLSSPPLSSLPLSSPPLSSLPLSSPPLSSLPLSSPPLSSLPLSSPPLSSPPLSSPPLSSLPLSSPPLSSPPLSSPPLSSLPLSSPPLSSLPLSSLPLSSLPLSSPPLSSPPLSSLPLSSLPLSSPHSPDQWHCPAAAVQSGLPRDPGQQTQSWDKSSSVPDQSSHELASHKNGVEQTDGVCEGDESYKNNGKDGVTENIVCHFGTVQDNPLPHSDSPCEESTSCASETVSATSLFARADANQPLTLESSVMPELTPGQNPGDNFVDAVISGACSDVQSAHSSDQREDSQGDVSVVRHTADRDSNRQSATGAHEVSRTAGAASCVRGPGEIPLTDSCVPNSMATSAAGVVVQDLSVQDTCNSFAAHTPDTESCSQTLHSSLAAQVDSAEDCSQNTDCSVSDTQESLGTSEHQGSVCEEVTSTEPGECRREPTLTQHRDPQGVIKSSGTCPQPRIPQSAAEQTSTNTTPEDEGSSVDPVESSRHPQASDRVLQDSEESASSDTDFEDVTSTMLDGTDAGRGAEDGRDLAQQHVVSGSDEASDDDDFFDACDEDEHTGETLLDGEHGVYRQTPDSHCARDLPGDCQPQSGASSGTDQASAQECFHCQETAPSPHAAQHGAPPGDPCRSRPRRQWIPDKPDVSLNLWSVLKTCMGKELSRIPMPVNFNEPLSMLQRLTEELEYSEILDRAALCEDSCHQMAHVAAFTVSAYATTQFRTAKPFNPLLGETFEFDRTDDLGWRTLAEQVSHHPPTLATHTEGRGWTLWQEFTMTIKFRGRYIQIIPMGMAHLKFSSSGHHYTWRKVTTTVHNVIVGRLWVDNEGLMDITDHSTGDVCHLRYQAYSFFSRDPHRKVTGVVRDRQGVAHWTLSGTWCSQIEAAPILTSPTEEGEEEGGKEEEEEGQTSISCYAGLASSSRNKEECFRTGPAQVLWKVRPPPEGVDKIYYFSRLAIEMNEPEGGVAPTDSRYRPDQRQMEEGDWEEANRLKFLLEEKQRGTRRRREAQAEAAREQGLEVPEYQPVWFRKETDPVTGNSLHVYTGQYWQCKENQQWGNCPDIFL